MANAQVWQYYSHLPVTRLQSCEPLPCIINCALTRWPINPFPHPHTPPTGYCQEGCASRTELELPRVVVWKQKKCYCYGFIAMIMIIKHAGVIPFTHGNQGASWKGGNSWRACMASFEGNQYKFSPSWGHGEKSRTNSCNPFLYILHVKNTLKNNVLQAYKIIVLLSYQPRNLVINPCLKFIDLLTWNCIDMNHIRATCW